MALVSLRGFLVYWFAFIFIILSVHFFTNLDWIAEQQQLIFKHTPRHTLQDLHETLLLNKPSSEIKSQENSEIIDPDSIEGSADDGENESGMPGIVSVDLTGGNRKNRKKQNEQDFDILRTEQDPQTLIQQHPKNSHSEHPKGLTTVGGSGIYVTHDLHQEDPEENEYISQISKKLTKEITGEISETARNSVVFGENSAQPALMYYNRIPKCGSTSLGNLLNATGEANDRFQIKHEHYRGIRFSFKNDKTKKVFYKEMQNLVNKGEALQKPIMYIRHQYYVNISSEVQSSKNDLPIVSLNMLRDPVERLISEYYFIRHGSEETQDVKNLNVVTNVKPHTVNETIDKCVEKRRGECYHDLEQVLVKFFCGQSVVCVESSNSNTALHRARDHLLHAYQYVGISERYEDSIKLLEATFPVMLKGIYDIYLTRYRTNTHNQTTRKMETSELTKRILRKMLKNDVDLYEMARFLFHEKFQHYKNNDLFIKESNL